MKKIFTLLIALLLTNGFMYAQEIIVKQDGSVINAYRTDYSGYVIYYQTEDTDTSAIHRIKKEDVLVIRLADGTPIVPNAEQPVQTNTAANTTPVMEESAFPDIDLTDYHGFLLDKGNCVYVTHDNNVQYEIEAADAIKQAIKANGMWTVVDKPNQAHFILQYSTCLLGQDFALLLFRPRENYIQMPNFGCYPTGLLYFKAGGYNTNEEVAFNVSVARWLIDHTMKNYKVMLESPDFMESVKTGQYYRSKGNKEKWIVMDFGFSRLAPDKKNGLIEKLHDLFYK